MIPAVRASTSTLLRRPGVKTRTAPIMCGPSSQRHVHLRQPFHGRTLRGRRGRRADAVVGSAGDHRRAAHADHLHRLRHALPGPACTGAAADLAVASLPTPTGPAQWMACARGSARSCRCSHRCAWVRTVRIAQLRMRFSDPCTILYNIHLRYAILHTPTDRRERVAQLRMYAEEPYKPLNGSRPASEGTSYTEGPSTTISDSGAVPSRLGRLSLHLTCRTAHLASRMLHVACPRRTGRGIGAFAFAAPTGSHTSSAVPLM
jgi:hypothetical protein